MKKKVEYKNDVEREEALEANTELRFVEDAIHIDGTYLVFTDEPEAVAPKSTEERLAALETRVVGLEKRPV